MFSDVLTSTFLTQPLPAGNQFTQGDQLVADSETATLLRTHPSSLTPELSLFSDRKLNPNIRDDLGPRFSGFLSAAKSMFAEMQTAFPVGSMQMYISNSFSSKHHFNRHCYMDWSNRVRADYREVSLQNTYPMSSISEANECMVPRCKSSQKSFLPFLLDVFPLSLLVEFTERRRMHFHTI